MLTISEVAVTFGVAKHFVRQTVLQGHVKFVRAGRKYLIAAENFNDFLLGANQQNFSNSIEETTQGKIRKQGQSASREARL